MSGLLAGAVITTFFAPAATCLAASSRLVNRPVDSKTTSTPRAIDSPFASTFARRLPSTESYFSRCASVCAFVRSFTATKSMFRSPSAARMMFRPMRPNPLMPTRTGIDISSRQTFHSTIVRPMYLAYSLLTLLAFIVVSPYFLYQAIRYKKYTSSLGQRLGYLPISFNVDGDDSIWIHAVSVGEALTARALAADLKTRYPRLRLFLSTTTIAGQQVARHSLQHVDAVFYFPFDFA